MQSTLWIPELISCDIKIRAEMTDLDCFPVWVCQTSKLHKQLVENGIQDAEVRYLNKMVWTNSSVFTE